MRKTLTLLILLVICCIQTKAAQPSPESPISIGVVLVDAPTIEGMIRVCKAFNLKEAPSEDGYYVYVSKKGCKVRFKRLVSADADDMVPVVDITSPQKLSDINKVLYQSGFSKSESTNGLKTYIRGSKVTSRITSCLLLSPYSMLFTKIVPE